MKNEIITCTVKTANRNYHYNVKIREVKSGYGFAGNLVLVKATEILADAMDDLYFAMAFRRCIEGEFIVTNPGTVSHEKKVHKIYYFA